MEKFRKFTIFLVFCFVLKIHSLAEASSSKSFVIHSFSNLFDNVQYSRKLVELFSNTVDGKALKIQIDFDGNSSKLITNLNYNVSSFVLQNFTSTMYEKYCRSIMTQVSYAFTIISDEPQAALFLYGCNIETLQNIKLFFIESFTSIISEDIYELLSIGNKRELKNPYFDSDEGFCTCINLKNQIESAEIFDRPSVIIVVAVTGLVILVALGIKAFKTIMTEEQLPYLP